MTTKIIVHFDQGSPVERSHPKLDTSFEKLRISHVETECDEGVLLSISQGSNHCDIQVSVQMAHAIPPLPKSRIVHRETIRGGSPTYTGSSQHHPPLQM